LKRCCWKNWSGGRCWKGSGTGGDFEGSGSLIGVEISSVVYTFGFCLKTRLSTQK